MPRNDAKKLNEEQTSLPKITTKELTVKTTKAIPTNELSDNEIFKQIVAEVAQTALEVKQIERDIIEQEKREEQNKQIQSQKGLSSIDDKNTDKDNTKLETIDEIVLPSTSNTEKLHSESLKTTVIKTDGSIYPKILELQDQPTLTPSENKSPDNADTQTVVQDELQIVGLLEPSPKRRRQRRIYIAEPDRRATLRSRKSDGSESIPISPSSSSSIAPTESKQQPTLEIEDTKSIASTETETLFADFWNKIESIDYEEPKVNRRKRGNPLISRKRTAKLSLSPNVSGSIGNLEVSSSTASATSANELDLESSPLSGNSKKKRTRNMSLYDRRYQTADERRGVGNGYVSGTVRNSSGGSASGAHSDIESQDVNSQYYMSTSNSNAANVSINGSVSLHHAPSMGTLCNIGNTCYLNSVVYTLRFAPYFLHNLHHLMYDLNSIQQTILRQRTAKSASLGRGVNAAHLENVRSWSNKDLASMEQYNNVSNTVGSSNNGSSSSCSKSSHQSLTEKLHDLYQSLNRNEMTDSSEPYHADTLLHAIQDVNATFEGNQQQDAHEFLMCLLNSIRETNQTLIKAIAECPDVIVNGYIVNPDEVDASNPLERDNTASTSSSVIAGGSVSSSTTTTTSSLTSKASFFSRKSKRKDAKASRLQSPLKDGSNLASTSGTSQQHPTSNSLFYLNTVDLSGANATQSSGTSALKSISDDEASSAICSLKDKVRIEEKIRELNLDFFNQDFEGVVVLTTKCLSCETVTKQKQGMLDISVPVPTSGYDNPDYSDKPSAYIQNSCITREYFRGENKYSCDQCTGYTEAIRSISYEVLPRLLVIQLNRFSGGMEKVNTYVPTTFTLPCFCAKCCELTEANKLHVYKLYSVITHVGATLSVGHYIAYTCCLDWANEYVNCPKDRRNTSTSQQHTVSSSEPVQSHNGSLATPVSAAASALASSGTSLMKKMKFGRSKASSSGDMSKNVKQLNGITSKAITNGIGKLSMNTTCHGLNCCAMRFSRGMPPPSQQSSAAGNSANSTELSEESMQNGTNSNLSYNNNSSSMTGSNVSFPPGYGSTGRGGNSKLSYSNSCSEPIWYMCDDDKIKAMSQREFEELLSPTRKITITPYLLFYARFDLQPTPPKQTTPTPPHPSWSNESLQSGLQKI